MKHVILVMEKIIQMIQIVSNVVKDIIKQKSQIPIVY